MRTKEELEKSVLQRVKDREANKKKADEGLEVKAHIFGFVVTGMLAIAMFYFFVIYQSPPASTTNPNSEVWAFTQMYVEGQLKSPKSADFPFDGVRHITPLGNNRFKVDSYVDAQNAFGANVRTHFKCIVKIKPLDMEQFSFK